MILLGIKDKILQVNINTTTKSSNKFILHTYISISISIYIYIIRTLHLFYLKIEVYVN